ncbi:helix-loop-helix protein 2 isoform X1 [Hylobates moloch]|uniref:helix-loop-helix protein 2 isoform X1 n=1 Tax=Hylobates moloch TaxID=81572 RepID=UPI00267674C9|nr:helix-loop-helix protein 2 isoform X1 [Hylobates moloch]
MVLREPARASESIFFLKAPPRLFSHFFMISEKREGSKKPSRPQPLFLRLRSRMGIPDRPHPRGGRPRRSPRPAPGPRAQRLPGCFAGGPRGEKRTPRLPAPVKTQMYSLFGITRLSGKGTKGGRRNSAVGIWPEEAQKPSRDPTGLRSFPRPRDHRPAVAVCKSRCRVQYAAWVNRVPAGSRARGRRGARALGPDPIRALPRSAPACCGEGARAARPLGGPAW